MAGSESTEPARIALQGGDRDRPSWLTDELVAEAVAAMDAVTGYSVRLTKMVDGEETHTASLPGEPPRDFAYHDDALIYAQNRMETRRVEAVARVFSAFAAKPKPNRCKPAPNPPAIWLSPGCEDATEEGRLWADEDAWGKCDGCDAPSSP